MQEAVALAHLSVATGSGDDDEEVSIPWPGVSDGMPRLLPVPSAWWETPAVERARIFFKFKMLLDENFEELVRCNTREHGKTLTESRGEERRYRGAGLCRQ